MWDDTDEEITMNGKPFLANRFSHSLRMHLWNEHCGLPLDDKRMTDPIADDVYRDIWMKTAKRNTQIFETVFPGIPQVFLIMFRLVLLNAELDQDLCRIPEEERSCSCRRRKAEGYPGSPPDAPC